MVFAVEKRTDVEGGVPFGNRVQAVISDKPEVLWGIVKESEVNFPKFAFNVGKRIMDVSNPETLLKFLGRNELKDKDLAQKLETEARSRMESRGGGKL
jgi:hypothetical protein